MAALGTGVFLIVLNGGQLPYQTDCVCSLGFAELNDMEAGVWVCCASALEPSVLLHTVVVVWAWPELLPLRGTLDEPSRNLVGRQSVWPIDLELSMWW